MLRAFPFIQSERCIVRLLENGEESAAIDFYGSNKEHFGPWGPVWPDNFLTGEFWTAQIQKNRLEFERDISARMFVFERDNPVPIGNVSLSGILRGAAQFCYLGYGLAKAKEGHGYMHEVLVETINFAFNDMNLHRLMANYIPGNDRSAKVLQRLGFVEEGFAREYLYLAGKWQDHVMTSLTNQNWQPQ